MVILANVEGCLSVCCRDWFLLQIYILIMVVFCLLQGKFLSFVLFSSVIFLVINSGGGRILMRRRF